MATPNKRGKNRMRRKAGASPSVFLGTRKKMSDKPAVKKGAGAKKPNMDIVVKRSNYSKAARAAVLASAAARQKLIEMGGENTIDVIREFDADMSDEELAKKTGIKPSEVRVVLNRLHNRGVFSYTRVRDRDSGWYSYIWRMNEGRLRDVGCGTGDGEGTVLAGPKEGYCCLRCSPDRVVDFADAAGAQFKCSCGSSLEYVAAGRPKRE